MPAPIVIFAFNRPDSLQRLAASLAQNALYDVSEKYVFVDGCRNETDRAKVERTIEVARCITPNVIVSQHNKGLGPSIIDGVSQIIGRFGSVIVLEDDLVCMPNFLRFMNKGLETYRDDERIFSICGYGLKISRPNGYNADVYLNRRSSSWGWATWADRWNTVDWAVSDWPSLQKDKARQRAFNRGGSDMFSMLRDYMAGRNRSWAIRFCYSQFVQGRWSVHPFCSLVQNEGFGADATNCKQTYSRFKTRCDNRLGGGYLMPRDIVPHRGILKENARYHGLLLRLYSRIRKLLRM